MNDTILMSDHSSNNLVSVPASMSVPFFRADCPEPEICRNCGGEGHIAKDCTEEAKTRMVKVTISLIQHQA